MAMDEGSDTMRVRARLDDLGKLCLDVSVDRVMPGRTSDEPPTYKHEEYLYAGAGAGGRFLKMFKEWLAGLAQ